MKSNRNLIQVGTPPEVFYFQFPGLNGKGALVHGVFTRHGGSSKPPYHSLNVSYGTGDDPDSVRVNLDILQGAVGARGLVFLNQVHGREVMVFREGDEPSPEGPYRADAMITDRCGLALMVKQADCQSVILFDPKRRVLANVHCGWRGNTQDILGRVVEKMSTHFGCRGSDLVAGIGPSLGPCCAEFRGYEKIFPDHFTRFMVRENYFDLWAVSRWQLVEAGLRERHIETAAMCTRCRTDLFYSYRAEGVTGRFGTLAMLTPENP